ncbi:MAG: thiamine pyrophosphate-binding protein [Bryobacterales bacterium]|nr:thiamine pyrophosphate-binding protein [Bryobacteraceae bacterium]MDW8355638.1 thiamine pyrophosphate-binding protein [Bryobacterales bacterium]
MPTGAELFVSALDNLGIREIFTLVGDHLNDALIEAARRAFRLFDFRHESGAAHAAEVWARLHRRPALALVTGGPGHTNALTGIATAQLAGSPLLAVSGAIATGSRGRQGFQEIDQVACAQPLVKWAGQPASGAEIPRMLELACREALSGRMGAVHLTIPVDLFSAPVDRPPPLPRPCRPEASPPHPPDVERALSLLRSAQRPVVIAGSGVWWAHAEAELRQFAERTSLPVYTVTLARGTLPDDHALAMGYADPALNRAAAAAFHQADVVLVLGKRVDYRLALGGPRLFSPEAQFIQVDIHAPELGKNRPVAVGLCADVRETLRAFLQALGRERWPQRPWLEQLRQLDRHWREQLDQLARDEGTPLHPAAVFRTLRELLPRDVLYAWDGGDFTHWGRAMLPALQPGGWVRLGPLGAIGASLPNATALQLANPGKRVVALTGDGALGFYLAELDTLVRLGLPVIIVVGNDAGWGLERELQRELHPGLPTVACELRPTRYDLIMKGFGGEGENVDTLRELAGAIARALASEKPYLVNVNIRGVRSPFTEWQIEAKRER